MRENMGLYHGKREGNGEWVEGYYFERKDTQGNIIESIIIVDAYEQITGGQRYLRSDLGYECFRVDPKTVGEYTGLPDKNGKRIFEGDVVKGVDHLNPYLSVSGYVSFADASFCIVDEYFSHYRWHDYELEVIGNIHDNPELLEVSGDE